MSEDGSVNECQEEVVEEGLCGGDVDGVVIGEGLGTDAGGGDGDGDELTQEDVEP